MTDRDFWLAIYRGVSAICVAIAKYKLGKVVKLVDLQPTETDSIAGVVFDKTE